MKNCDEQNGLGKVGVNNKKLSEKKDNGLGKVGVNNKKLSEKKDFSKQTVVWDVSVLYCLF